MCNTRRNIKGSCPSCTQPAAAAVTPTDTHPSLPPTVIAEEKKRVFVKQKHKDDYKVKRGLIRHRGVMHAAADRRSVSPQFMIRDERDKSAFTLCDH